MKKNPNSETGVCNLRSFLAFSICSVGVVMAVVSRAAPNGEASAASAAQGKTTVVGEEQSLIRGVNVWEDHHDTSLPLSELGKMYAPTSSPLQNYPSPLLFYPPSNHPYYNDGALQSTNISSSQPIIIGLNFEGQDFDTVCNCAPPSPSGAVGTTQYVQTVNTVFDIYDKTTGALVDGPHPTNAIWTGFGGECESENDGNATVTFDKAAKRWVITQTAIGPGGGGPYFQCVAVSTTDDATGSYNRYAFSFGTVNFPDDPKLGVWPATFTGASRGAYLLSVNIFTNLTSFTGPMAVAFDRNAMLSGAAASMQQFQLTDITVDGILPADMDGTVAPAANEPSFFMKYDADGTHVDLYKLTPNFLSSGTLTGPTKISVAAFTPYATPSTGGRNDIPENSGDGTALNSIGERPMYRLAWRNINGTEHLNFNHTVQGTNNSAAIRWYDIINPNGTPTAAQAGTFSPDANYRWMGSTAMDSAGDQAIGFSQSSASTNPSIWIAARTPSDPANTMESQINIITGGGSQNGGLDRWGDYSSMQVDPVDDCTFWYTQEYIKTTGSFNWNTRIASFKFQTCGPPATFVVTTTADHDDGSCTVSDCTLREAINYAPTGSTITFAANVTGSITLSLGTLNVTGSTTIIGPGARVLQVNGNATYRIFYFSTGPSTISGLTISNGAIVGPAGGPVTGAAALFNQGTLTVNDCTLSGNQARGSDFTFSGGGDGGTVEGGAVANSGTLTLNRCTVSGNSAAGGRGGDNFMTFAHAGHGGAGEGGAVFNYATGTLSINNCTFNGNGATGGAGGNGSFGGGGGNGSGAAVFNLGMLTVTGATVSGNTGSGGAGGFSNSGPPGVPGLGIGGLAAAGGSNAVGDTISAGNSGNNGGGKDVNGTFSSNGYNLIGSGDHSTGFTNGTNHDQVGTDAASVNAQLGALQNNGGPTNTMALLSGSPAINTGDPNAPTQDQRYYLRNGVPDIGAFEFGGALAPASAVSQKTHGSAGTFNITMPLTGSVGIECRSGGATNDHQLMVTFPSPITINGSPQAQVTSGTGQIGTGGISNGGVVTLDQTKTVVIVPLTNVANAHQIAVTLSSVSDGTNTNHVIIPMDVLLGDTTGNGAVNSSDIAQTQSQSGQPVNSSNFREDVTVNGSINSSDIALVQSKSGTALPVQ